MHSVSLSIISELKVMMVSELLRMHATHIQHLHIITIWWARPTLCNVTIIWRMTHWESTIDKHIYCIACEIVVVVLIIIIIAERFKVVSIPCKALHKCSALPLPLPFIIIIIHVCGSMPVVVERIFNYLTPFLLVSIATVLQGSR